MDRPTSRLSLNKGEKVFSISKMRPRQLKIGFVINIRLSSYLQNE